MSKWVNVLIFEQLISFIENIYSFIHPFIYSFRKLKKKKQTFLWQIKHAKSDAPSYLFGTMHVRDQRAFGALPVLEEKIAECAAFAAEFDFEEAKGFQANNQMQITDNQSLKTLFKPKKYKKIATFLEKQTGMDIAFFDQQKPFLIYQLITETLFQKDMPFALDRYLYEYAKAQDKALTGVETFAEQMAIMEKITLEEQAKILYQTVKNFKNYRKQLKKLTQLYQSGNLQQLNKSARKGMGSLRKLLVDDRNYIMADRIAEMTAKQSTFVAIGAGHLGGKNGVLRILKLKNMKLKPIKVT